MSSVLDYVRSREPQFRDVPDSELTRYLAERQPDFLQDEEFKSDFDKITTIAEQQKQQRAITRMSEMDVAAGNALGAIGEFVQNAPANILNIPQALSKATGLEPMEKPFLFQYGQPIAPEILKAPEALTADIEKIMGTTRGGTGIPDASAQAIAGALKGGEDLARGLTTPEVAMTMGGAGVPGAARQLVKQAVPTVFAEQMIAHTPETYQQLGTASVEGTPADVARAGVGAVGSTLMVSGMLSPSLIKAYREATIPTKQIVAEAAATGSPKTAAALLEPTTKGEPSALPIQETTSGLLRQERPQVELPGVAAGGAAPGQAGAQVAPKAGEVLTFTKRNAKGAVDSLFSTMTRDEMDKLAFMFGDSVSSDVVLNKSGDALRYSNPEMARGLGDKQSGATTSSINSDFANWLVSEKPLRERGEDAAEAALLNKARQVLQPTSEAPRPGTPLAETPTTQVVEQKPPAAPDLTARLEALKFKGEGGLSGELYTLRPDILSKVGKQLWNDAIDLAIAGIKAGKAIGDAVNDAVAHIRSKVQDVDEAGLREGFKDIFAREPVAVPDTTGESVKMRKSAERATESPDIPEPVQETIKTAPESFYPQQSMKRVEETVATMPEAELAAVPVESNLYTAAKLEQARRLFESGNNEAGYQVFVELEKQGTRFGQLINQFKLLAGSRPENVVAVLNKQLEKAGRDPLTEAQAAKALEIAIDSKAKDAALDRATDAWTKDPTDANAKAAEAALTEANKAALELQRFVGRFQPRSLPSILKSVLQGNLLTPISEVANIVGNLSFLPFRGAARTVGTGLDILDAFIRGKPRELSVGPSGATEALKGAVRGLKQVPEIVKRGTGEAVQGETRAGLHPIRAWINQFARNPEAPTKGGKLTFADRIGLAIEGTFGVPAEAMLRGLGAGDAPFREAARSRVIAEALRLGKVPRDKWAMAQQFPELFFNRETIQRIGSETAAAIFQRDSQTLNLFTRWLRGKGELLDLFAATVAPYKLTPWNIIGEIMSFNPLIAMAKTAIEAKKGNSRQAKLNAGKFVVGSMLTAAGYWLYKQGLMAPSLDQRDEAQKARMLANEVLPPNHINLSGLKRALAGGDPTFQKGDETADVFRAGGLAGAMFYMTANIGREFERNPQMGGEEKFLALLTQSGLEQARFGMNQSFLQGVEGLLSAVKDGNAENYVTKWVNTVTSIPLPNTLNTITKASQKYQTDVRDDSLKARVDNYVNKKLGFAGADEYLPLRRGLWGEPLLETPKDKSALVHHFFDITKGRQVTSDPVNLELYRLWRKTGSTEVIPSIPTREITHHRETYHLNPQQYSRMVELVGQNRRGIVDAKVVNPNFHTRTDEQRIKLLNGAYDIGRDRGTSDFLKENPVETLAKKPKRAGF